MEVLPPKLPPPAGGASGLHVELSVSDRVEDLLQQEARYCRADGRAPAKGAGEPAIGALDIGFYRPSPLFSIKTAARKSGDLRQHRLIGYDRPLPYIRAILEARPDLAALTFAFRADSNLAQLAAIRSGLGIGMCQADSPAG